MKVEVTYKDIAEGFRGMPSYCPIALALQRCASQRVKVLRNRVQTHNGESFLPTEARSFIVAFDAGKIVKPFSFEIEL